MVGDEASEWLGTSNLVLSVSAIASRLINGTDGAFRKSLARLSSWAGYNKTIDPFLSIIVLLFVALFPLYFLAICLSWVSYGLKLTFYQPLLQLSTDITPEGTWNTVSLPGPDSNDGVSSLLTHIEIHNSTVTLTTIRNWIAEREQIALAVLPDVR
jgi:hypothetical protein